MAARITGATLEALRQAVAPLDTSERRARYIARDFPRSEQVRDLDTRYRWDLFWAARGWSVLRQVDDADDLLDAHIATALRTIVPALA